MTKSSADAAELGYGRSAILKKKLYLRGYVGAPPASIQLSKHLKIGTHWYHQAAYGDAISGYGDGERVECGHFPAVQVGVKSIEWKSAT